MKQLLVRPEYCVGCKSCEIACAVAHSQSKTLFGALQEELPPQRRVSVETDGEITLPLQCRQCSDSPCVHACMAGAMHRDAETGLVQVDPDKCVGCWMCVMVCPFGAISESPLHKAVKCDRCREQDYQPACVEACPTKALRWVEVDRFSKSERQSFIQQLKEGYAHA